MCGIVGIVGMSSDVSLQRLLVNSASRGKDATGLYSQTTGIVKAPCPASKFVTQYADALRSAQQNLCVIGHTRAATQGTPRDNDNNHPLDSKKYVIVHNGSAWLSDVKGYRYKGQCDSERIVSYMETYGVIDGLKQFRGSAALLWMKKTDPHTVYTWRHNSPLYAAYHPEKQCIVFASTRDIVEESLSTPYIGFFTRTPHSQGWVISEVPEHQIWKVSHDGKKLTCEKMCECAPESSLASAWDLWGDSMSYPWERPQKSSITGFLSHTLDLSLGSATPAQKNAEAKVISKLIHLSPHRIHVKDNERWVYSTYVNAFIDEDEVWKRPSLQVQFRELLTDHEKILLEAEKRHLCKTVASASTYKSIKPKKGGNK